MDSKIVQGDESISNTSASSIVRDLKEELIHVSQALGVIENVCKMSSTTRVNKHQCKRIADRFSAIGDELKALGFDRDDFVWEKSLNSGGSNSSSSKDLPFFEKLLAVLRRGEALILYFREWEEIMSVVSRMGCRSGEFEKIHKQLDTIKGFESTLKVESALITADAEKDMEEMSKMLEDAALNSEIEYLDSFVASEGSSSLQSASSTWRNSNVEVQQVENHPVSALSHMRINPSDIKKVEEIGSGASAKVYEATWLGCRCAVKRFFKAYSRNWVSELQQEVDFLSKLRHPHIVQLMGLSVDSQERCSIVMEWMECSLRKLIDNRMRDKRSIVKKEDINLAPIVPFKFSEALDIITKIALGMWFIHSKGVSHRDLKSPNVLVRYPGSYKQQIKIVDFGAARHVDSNVMQAMIGVGTGFWRAPEILPTKTTKAAHQLSKPNLMAADVYSFAMTCYEVLTGELPFKGVSRTSESYDKVIAGDRPELPGNLDSDLKGLINSCWDRDPRHRPNFEKICKQLMYIKSKKQALLSNRTLEKHVWRSVLVKAQLQVSKKLIHRVHRVNHGKEFTLSSAHKEITLNSLMWKDRLERSDSLVYLPEHLRIDPSQLVKVRNILQGSNAKFYEATWLGSSVVVKKLIFWGSSYREQQREVNFLIKLSRHPYIAQLVGLSVDSKMRFLIVMEMTSGSLRALIGSRMDKRELVTAKKERGFVMPFDIHEALLIIMKIALAMVFLHSNGVMHRSLSSVKVLAEERTGCIDVKLQGFGMSINEHSADSSDIDESDYLDVDRTSFWSAPEILPIRTADRSRKPDLMAADVYSFALICYEVLTGELPFQGHLRYEEYNRVISGDRPRLPPDLHPELRALIEQCWHGDPVERPNFTEICEKLRGIEEGLPYQSQL